MKNFLSLILLMCVICISCTSDKFSSLPNRMVLSLGSDQITISSPKGYCINEETQRRHASGFSVIISDCFEIFNNRIRTLVRSPVRSLVTITVSNTKVRSDDELNSLDSLIMSGSLDNAFGRTSENLKVKTLKRLKAEGVYYMCFEEEVVNSELDAAFQSKNFCRAVFVLNQRIISLVGSDYPTQYTDEGRIENLIKDTVSALLRANNINEA